MKKILFLFLCISPVYIVGMTEEEKLLDAVRNQNIDEIKSLIDKVGVQEKGEALWNAVNIQQSIPEIVKFLLEKGADVNIINYGRTPLYLAIVNKNLEMVKLLIQYGANINQKLDDKTHLMWAIEKSTPEIVEFLLKNKANPNARDSEGKTVLFLAGPDIEMIKLLIQYGADVNYQMNISGQSYKNMTFLMIAAYYGDVQLLKELLAANADVLLTTSDGKTAFLIANAKFKDQTTSTENKKKYKEIMDLLEAKEKEIKKMPKIAPSVGQTLFPALQKFTQTLQALQIKIKK